MTLNLQRTYISSELRVSILSLMSFINHDDIISHLTQVHVLGGNHAIACHKNASLFTECSHLIISNVFFLIVELENVITARTPFVEFLFPISFHRCRYNNQNLLDHLGGKQPTEITSNLDGLSKAHVVTKYTTFFCVPKVVQPFDTLLLMIKEIIIDLGWQAEVSCQVVLFVFGVEFVCHVQIFSILNQTWKLFICLTVIFFGFTFFIVRLLHDVFVF